MTPAEIIRKLKDRGERLGLHPYYKCRLNPSQFDDRPLKDEWQNEVYRKAHALAIQANYRSILDFGCGSGFKLMKYFIGFETAGFEIVPCLDFLRSTYPDRRWEYGANLDKISLDGDLLICADVIEHMEDPVALLGKIAASRIDRVFISTPALEILADRGRSNRWGPPDNESHYNEWTTEDFRRFVGQHLNVLEHTMSSVEQGTQLLICTTN